MIESGEEFADDVNQGKIMKVSNWDAMLRENFSRKVYNMCRELGYEIAIRVTCERSSTFPKLSTKGL